MKLGDLLQDGLVVLDFEARDHVEAITRLVDRLIEKGRLRPDQRRRALDALVARERIASTGMEHGIALPHATVDAVDEAVAAIGVSPKGVPFRSADGKPATILILLLIPRRSVQQHIKTLAGIDLAEAQGAIIRPRLAKEFVGVVKRARSGAGNK